MKKLLKITPGPYSGDTRKERTQLITRIIKQIAYVTVFAKASISPLTGNPGLMGKYRAMREKEERAGNLFY